MSSTYYTRVKTQEKILRELRDSIKHNLNVVRNALENSKIETENLITNIKGVDICDFKNSIFEDYGIIGTYNSKEDKILITKEDIKKSNMINILDELKQSKSSDTEFINKIDNYMHIVNSYSLNTKNLIDKYNEFIDQTIAVKENNNISYLTKEKIIDDLFSSLINYLNMHAKKSDTISNKLIKIIKKIYQIEEDIEIDDNLDMNTITSLIEKKYVDNSISKVLRELGYKDYSIVSFENNQGLSYEHDDLLNRLFIAKDNDNLIIESIYDDETYKKNNTDSIKQNFKSSCQQNQLLIQKLKEYGIELEILFKEEPEIHNVSILKSNSIKQQRIHQKKKEMKMSG